MTGWQRGLIMVMAAGLLCYAFLWLPWFEGFRTAETLVSAFLLVTIFRFWREWFRNEPLMLLWLVLLGYLLLAQLWYLWALPDEFDPSSKVTRHYLKPLLVLAVAVVAVQLGRRFLFWWAVAAVLGMLVYLMVNIDSAYWERALAGRRVDFGMRNAQHAGLIFGTLLLAMVCYLPRVLLARTPLWQKVFGAAAVSLLVILALVGVVVTQVRGVWLGLGLAALIVVVALGVRLWLWQRATEGHRNHTRGLVAGVLVLALLGMTGVGLNLDERVVKRFNQVAIPWDQLADAGNPGELNMDSAGVRLASWWVAGEWVMERPGFGWGAGAVEPLIDRSDYFSDRFKQRFGHLHNMYLEAFVAHGLVGGLLFLALFGWMACSIWISYRRGSMPGDVALFGAGFCAFWAVVNLFESYYLYTSGQYVVTLAFGFLYSFHFEDCQRPIGDK